MHAHARAGCEVLKCQDPILNNLSGITNVLYNSIVKKTLHVRCNMLDFGSSRRSIS